MKDAIRTQLAKSVKCALDLNHGLWTGAFKSDATRAVAEAALEVQQGKVGRCLRVLKIRYGVDLSYRTPDEVLAYCNA